MLNKLLHIEACLEYGLLLEIDFKFTHNLIDCDFSVVEKGDVKVILDAL